jgi:hypothetical protein
MALLNFALSAAELADAFATNGLALELVKHVLNFEERDVDLVLRRTDDAFESFIEPFNCLVDEQDRLEVLNLIFGRGRDNSIDQFLAESGRRELLAGTLINLAGLNHLLRNLRRSHSQQVLAQFLQRIIGVVFRNELELEITFSLAH